MGMMAPWFDEVLIDDKPKGLTGLWRLRRKLRGFDRIYDLQTSSRTNLYYKVLWPHRPKWNGNAPGCSHPDPTPVRSAVHAFQLRVNQLKAAGIAEVPPADLSWLESENRGPRLQDLPERYVLLVPGAATHRPAKRWPADRYAALAAELARQGLTSVVIGSASESEAARVIAVHEPSAIDLTGETTLFDIASLARRAKAAVGNDTGPMHLVAAVGCPSLVLFCTAEADPAHSSPAGRQVGIIAREDLATLDVPAVMVPLQLLLG